MHILAIDTTGFSASVALVKDGKEVLFNKIKSGYIPKKNWEEYSYLLPGHHQDFLLKNLKEINWEEIDAIAVSANSGIYTCILTGVSIAKALSFCCKKPLIEVDHILAHLYSSWLERNPKDFQFPILVFSASGSHSDFSLLRSKKHCEIIHSDVPRQKNGNVKIFVGVGKIFDKLGRRLGVITSSNLGVRKLMHASSKGNPSKYDFTKYYKGALLDLDFLDFMNRVDKFLKKEERNFKKGSQSFINNVAASFQESITEILAKKILEIASLKKAREIHIAGGISENKYLKKKLKEKIKKEKLPFVLRYPVKKEYRLDNAAMIGALAYYQEKYKIKFKNFKPNITK